MSTTTKTKGTRQIPYSQIKQLLRKFVISANKHDHVEMANLLKQLPPKSSVCHDPVLLAIIKSGCRRDELRLAEAHGFHFMKVEWEYDTAEHISPETLLTLLQEYPEYALEEQDEGFLIEILLSFNLLHHVNVAFAFTDPTTCSDKSPLIVNCKSMGALDLLITHRNISAIYKPRRAAFLTHREFTVLDDLMDKRWKRKTDFTSICIYLGMSCRLNMADKEFQEFHQACVADEDASFEIRYRFFFARSFTSKLLHAIKTTNFHLHRAARRLN